MDIFLVVLVFSVAFVIALFIFALESNSPVFYVICSILSMVIILSNVYVAYTIGYLSYDYFYLCLRIAIGFVFCMCALLVMSFVLKVFK